MGMKKQNDDEPSKMEDPRAKPGPNAGKWEKFKWAVTYPLYTLSSLTIPGIIKTYQLYFIYYTLSKYSITENSFSVSIQIAERKNGRTPLC